MSHRWTSSGLQVNNQDCCFEAGKGESERLDRIIIRLADSEEDELSENRWFGFRAVVFSDFDALRLQINNHD